MTTVIYLHYVMSNFISVFVGYVNANPTSSPFLSGIRNQSITVHVIAISVIVVGEPCLS